jgi:TonB family protein
MTRARNRRAWLNVAAIFLFAFAFAGRVEGQEEVFDIGPGITPPKVVRQVSPAYKPDAKGFRISGTIVVGLVVSSRGEPVGVHVVRSLEKDVDQSAVDAVMQWAFEPAKKGDQAVAVRITVEIRFHSM